jgi:hypothetical protein
MPLNESSYRILQTRASRTAICKDQLVEANCSGFGRGHVFCDPRIAVVVIISGEMRNLEIFQPSSEEFAFPQE